MIFQNGCMIILFHLHGAIKKGFGQTVIQTEYIKAYYVNHSDEPNIGIDDDEFYIAIKDIKKDEELLYRYSTNEQSWKWQH